MFPAQPDLSYLKDYKFHPVVKIPPDTYVHDFSKGQDPSPKTYSVGRYNEKRKGLYNQRMYQNPIRNIHMGLDIGAPKGQEVYSFYKGEIFIFADHSSPGDYGPTLILKYTFTQGPIYALYGHLSRDSLIGKYIGQSISMGEVIGSIGSTAENGGWPCHLHFQISTEEPKGAQMPGVVSQAEHASALKIYPDPRCVLNVSGPTVPSFFSI